MKVDPPTLLDGYKTDHRRQYPVNSRTVFSNLTARGSRVSGVKHVVAFAFQFFVLRFLVGMWNKAFFERPIDEVAARFTRRINAYLPAPNRVGEEHIRALHKLGYLPLHIMAIPEGTHVPIRVPMLVMWNTHKAFFWLTNAIETILSTTVWLPCTSATTAFQYKKLLTEWAETTAPEMMEFVPWQGHDFSFRGHTCMEAAMASGGAHLLSFTGTDTVPAIDFLEEYYQADVDKEIVGGSVAATEHSVMCMGGEEDEVETFRRLIEDVYPDGVVSIVSDTWNFWDVINPDNGILVQLYDKVMNRDGKVVIRPDSGDPVKIVTGYRWIDIDEADITADDALEQDYEVIRYQGKFYKIQNDPSGRIGAHISREISFTEVKGLVECLWEIFGGTTNDAGYRILDEHIGAIYGDSITLTRCDSICRRLAYKKFASTNVVFGIGSFTYQGAIEKGAIVTRDTYGFAVKSTYGEVEDGNGETKGIEIFKDPITDDGLKKSAKGLTAVYRNPNTGELELKDQADWEEVMNCEFQTIFKDGEACNLQTLSEIREKIAVTAP